LVISFLIPNNKTINTYVNNKNQKNMKTIYSLKEFHQEVAKIANKDPKYCSARVEYGIHDEYKFECYVDGYNKVFRGSTMEESLNKLREAVSPNPAPNIDVEIDIEQPEEIL
jgi:hypothetical protein